MDSTGVGRGVGTGEFHEDRLRLQRDMLARLRKCFWIQPTTGELGPFGSQLELIQHLDEVALWIGVEVDILGRGPVVGGEALVQRARRGRLARRLGLTLAGLAIITAGLITALMAPGPRHTIRASGATLRPYAYRGNYPSVTGYDGGKITIAPPDPSAAAKYTATPQDVYNSFVSKSPAAAAARAAGFGMAEIYKATYSDRGQGVLNISTNVITPAYHNTPVWILTYQAVHWPVGGTGGQAIPSPEGGKGTYRPSQLSPGLQNVYVIFNPAGDCLDTIVLPAG